MPLTRRFEQLWKSSAAPPDVFGYLRQQKTADSDQWLAVLLIDQQRRWLTDKPLQVEDYLAGLPDLPAGIDWKLQLAIGEFQARRDTARPLSIHEISSRFPDLTDTLRERMQPLVADDQASAKPGQNAPDLLQTVIKVPTKARFQKLEDADDYLADGGQSGPSAYCTGLRHGSHGTWLDLRCLPVHRRRHTGRPY